jgi:hypothetical protein
MRIRSIHGELKPVKLPNLDSRLQPELHREQNDSLVMYKFTCATNAILNGLMMTKLMTMSDASGLVMNDEV